MTGYMRLKRPHVVRIEPLQVDDAVALCLRLYRIQALGFAFACCDDEFTDAINGHLMCIAIVIQQLFALNTQLRFKRAVGIVNPSVYNLRVSAARMHADIGFGFQDDDLASSHRQRSTNSQADDTSTDYDAIQSITHCSSLVGHCWPYKVRAAATMPPSTGITAPDT